MHHTLLLTCLALLLSLTGCQKPSLAEARLRQLFYGLDLTASPEQMVKKSDLNFEPGWVVIPGLGGELKQFHAEVSTHPLLEAKPQSGRVLVETRQNGTSDEQVVRVSIILYFADIAVALEEYDKLKTEFDDYSDRIAIESQLMEDYDLKSETVSFQFYKKQPYPQLVMGYDSKLNEEENGFPISFSYYGVVNAK